MLLLILFILAIIFIILSVMQRNKSITYNTKALFSLIKSFIFLIVIIDLIIIVFFSTFIATAFIYQGKIEDYENENIKISNGFYQTLSNYEKDKNIDLSTSYSSESIIYLINSIPEISSSNLIEEKINIYIENEKEIMNLKLKLHDISIYKWLLYFGN